MDAGEKGALQDALNLLRDAVAEADGDENKHPEVLITAERFTALAGGARVTSCKSGKDRTGMAATKAARKVERMRLLIMEATG